MVCTLSAYTARFTILSDCYIQTIKVGQDTANFTFWILPKQQQNGVEKQSNQGCMAEIMQRLDEMLR
jgi:hypothetical protein